MLNQDKMIIIDAPHDAGPITRFRFWNERFKVKRPLQALPEILQPDEELYIVVGGNIDKGSLQTTMQALGMATGSSASGFMNALPGLLFGLLIALPIFSIGTWLSFAAASVIGQVPLIGTPLGAVVSFIIFAGTIALLVLAGTIIAPLYGSAIVATDRRVMYVKKPWVGLEVRDFTYSQMSSISQDTGLMSATVTIQLAGSGIRFTQILKEKSGPLMNAVRGNISRPQSVSLDSTSIEALTSVTNAPSRLGSPPTDGQRSLSGGDGDSNLETLERLANLRDRGVLSEEEFAEEKSKVLRGD